MELLSPLLLTLNFNGGRIMAEFREEEHPRDNDGKFKDKGASDKFNKLIEKCSDNPEQDKKNIIQTQNNNTPNKGTLTKQEWALWYKAVAEYKKLGYWEHETPNGNGILKIETNNSTKIVITSGTYENPKAMSIYSFKNNEDILDFIKELENYEK